MPKSPEEMANAMIANMKEKTGKTLGQWLAITKKAGAKKHGELVKMLAEFGVVRAHRNHAVNLRHVLDVPAGTRRSSALSANARPDHRPHHGNQAPGGGLTSST